TVTDRPAAGAVGVNVECQNQESWSVTVSRASLDPPVTQLQGRNVEGAAEAPPSHENVHIHQQDSPHELSEILPGIGAPWCLLRGHEDQEKKGGFPLHRRHLVLRGDGDGSGMRLLQMPAVTGRRPAPSLCNTHLCHSVN
ncbi:hypothetical protein GOODEAATRI_018994, partial [Goodea atripinnis]